MYNSAYQAQDRMALDLGHSLGNFAYQLQLATGWNGAQKISKGINLGITAYQIYMTGRNLHFTIQLMMSLTRGGANAAINGATGNWVGMSLNLALETLNLFGQGLQFWNIANDNALVSPEMQRIEGIYHKLTDIQSELKEIHLLNAIQMEKITSLCVMIRELPTHSDINKIVSSQVNSKVHSYYETLKNFESEVEQLAFELEARLKTNDDLTEITIKRLNSIVAKCASNDYIGLTNEFGEGWGDNFAKLSELSWHVVGQIYFEIYKKNSENLVNVPLMLRLYHQLLIIKNQYKTTILDSLVDLIENKLKNCSDALQKMGENNGLRTKIQVMSDNLQQLLINNQEYWVAQYNGAIEHYNNNLIEYPNQLRLKGRNSGYYSNVIKEYWDKLQMAMREPNEANPIISFSFHHYGVGDWNLSGYLLRPSKELYKECYPLMMSARDMEQLISINPALQKAFCLYKEKKIILYFEYTVEVTKDNIDQLRLQIICQGEKKDDLITISQPIAQRWKYIEGTTFEQLFCFFYGYNRFSRDLLNWSFIGQYHASQYHHGFYWMAKDFSKGIPYFNTTDERYCSKGIDYSRYQWLGGLWVNGQKLSSTCPTSLSTGTLAPSNRTLYSRRDCLVDVFGDPTEIDTLQKNAFDYAQWSDFTHDETDILAFEKKLETRRIDQVLKVNSLDSYKNAYATLALLTRLKTGLPYLRVVELLQHQIGILHPESIQLLIQNKPEYLSAIISRLQEIAKVSDEILKKIRFNGEHPIFQHIKSGLSDVTFEIPITYDTNSIDRSGNLLKRQTELQYLKYFLPIKSGFGLVHSPQFTDTAMSKLGYLNIDFPPLTILHPKLYTVLSRLEYLNISSEIRDEHFDKLEFTLMCLEVASEISLLWKLREICELSDIIYKKCLRLGQLKDIRYVIRGAFLGAAAHHSSYYIRIIANRCNANNCYDESPYINNHYFYYYFFFTNRFENFFSTSLDLYNRRFIGISDPDAPGCTFSMKKDGWIAATGISTRLFNTVRDFFPNLSINIVAPELFKYKNYSFINTKCSIEQRLKKNNPKSGYEYKLFNRFGVKYIKHVKLVDIVNYYCFILFLYILKEGKLDLKAVYGPSNSEPREIFFFFLHPDGKQLYQLQADNVNFPEFFNEVDKEQSYKRFSEAGRFKPGFFSNFKNKEEYKTWRYPPPVREKYEFSPDMD